MKMPSRKQIGSTKYWAHSVLDADFKGMNFTVNASSCTWDKANQRLNASIYPCVIPSFHF